LQQSHNAAVGRAWIIWLIAPMVALTAASTDIYLPSLPGVAADFHASSHQVQLTLSAFMYGYGATQLICGPLSDRFGRRPVLVAGLLLYVAATIGCLFAPTIEWLIALRFVQAIGACAPPVIGRAVVRDVFASDQIARAFSSIAMVFTMAPIAAPMVGGYLEGSFGWRANFVMLMAIGVALLGATHMLLKETNPHINPLALRPSRLVGNYVTMLANRRFLGYALCMGVSFSGVFAYISESPFILIDLVGLSPEAYGTAFGLVAIGFGLGSFACGRLAHRHGVDGTIAIGIVCYIIAALTLNALALAGILNVYAICLPMTGVSIAIGLIMPNCQAGAVSPFPMMAGAASALIGFMHTTLSSSTGLTVGRLHDGTQFPMTLATLVCGVVLVALFFGLIRRRAADQSRIG